MQISDTSTEMQLSGATADLVVHIAVCVSEQHQIVYYINVQDKVRFADLCFEHCSILVSDT